MNKARIITPYYCSNPIPFVAGAGPNGMAIKPRVMPVWSLLILFLGMSLGASFILGIAWFIEKRSSAKFIFAASFLGFVVFGTTFWAWWDIRREQKGGDLLLYHRKTRVFELPRQRLKISADIVECFGIVAGKKTEEGDQVLQLQLHPKNSKPVLLLTAFLQKDFEALAEVIHKESGAKIPQFEASAGEMEEA
jgi:hypothetical protein